MVISKEMNLLTSIDSFLNGYSGIISLMTTPVPFPLVQMAHTIVLFYVFTLPLAFLNDTEGTLVSDCFGIFAITYGFWGLTIVSAELDDPLGDDVYDFDVEAYAEIHADDVLIMIHDADGKKWVDNLLHKMGGNILKPVNETTDLLPTERNNDTNLMKNSSDLMRDRNSSWPRFIHGEAN